MSVVSDLAALMRKVDGDPQAIRTLASGLRRIGGHVDTATGRLATSVKEVLTAWEGGSAVAFSDHMAAYPKAGGDLKSALSSCASALDTVAGALESARGTISGLHQAAGTAESEYRRNHEDATQADIDGYVKSKLGGDPVGRAGKAVRSVEEALSTAQRALDKQLGTEGFRFFQDIRQPGGADFLPGDHKADWRRKAGYQPVAYASYRDQEDGGAPAGGGWRGGAGAPSSYGNVPAAKPQVVEWIKEALTVIRSPEMAGILQQRGLDVSDLDPNDPQDIQRIWTVIHHESGGNPNAINTWDVNARNGVPSQGLMQTIPPTFNAHHLPGYDKIREPVDNIIAGVLYTYSRYGNLSRHPGLASLASNGVYAPY